MFDEESEQFEDDLFDDDEDQDDEFVMCEACGGLGELFGPLGGHRQMCGYCSGSGLQVRE